MTLKQRLGMLRGVYGEEMPYRDPHTAAPALWALRRQDGCHFEVSVSVRVQLSGVKEWRRLRLLFTGNSTGDLRQQILVVCQPATACPHATTRAW